jgi:two-component system nitrate/nitrite response regulator NarL
VRAMNAGKAWTVVIADDHAVVRLGVRALLATAQEFTVVGEAADGEMTVDIVRGLRPDILILDLAMPKLPGLAALRALTEEVGLLRPVLLTGDVTSRQILEALQLGARGVVLKEEVSGGLLDALRTIVEGRYWVGGKPVANLVQAITSLMAESGPPPNTFGLTAREFDMIAAVVEGCSNKEIARRHSLSEETVKRHLTNVFDKTGVSSRLELAMFAVHHRLIASRE